MSFSVDVHRSGSCHQAADLSKVGSLSQVGANCFVVGCQHLDEAFLDEVHHICNLASTDDSVISHAQHRVKASADVEREGWLRVLKQLYLLDQVSIHAQAQLCSEALGHCLKNVIYFCEIVILDSQVIIISSNFQDNVIWKVSLS